MPGGLEAVVAAIDEIRHNNFQTAHYHSGTSLSFRAEQRFFRVHVTSEFDEDYDAAKNPLNSEQFRKALASTPDGNLTVSRRGLTNE
ncbi:MAG: hypothetical protein WA738_18490 [Candidatus Angelobacter sp.]